MRTRVCVAALLLAGAAYAQEQPQQDAGPITVQDLARFAEIGDPRWLDGGDTWPGSPPGETSPDGRYVSVVLRQGNVAAGTNDAQLLLFDTRDWDRPPRSLVKFASASNSHAMAFVRWMPDSRSLIFAGTDRKSPSQIYRLDRASAAVQQLTQLAQPLLGFELLPSTNKLVVFTEPERHPPEERADCKTRGCRVMATQLWRQRRGIGEQSPYVSLVDIPSRQVTPIVSPETQDPTIGDCIDRFEGEFSPNGRFGVRSCTLKSNPHWWREYSADAALRWAFDSGLERAAQTLVLTDFVRNEVRRIGDAPVHWMSVRPVWIDQGRAFLLPGALQSLTGTQGPERERLRTHLVIQMFDLAESKLSTVVQLDPEIAGVTASSWDEGAQTLRLEVQDRNRKALPAVAFRREASRWSAVEAGPAAAPREDSQDRLVVEQSLNLPPQLYVHLHRGGKRKLLDPNPWLAERRLGKVEAIAWTASDGQTWQGGLYYPPHYRSGVRYPVLIQTHGFDPDTFSLQGKGRIFPGRALAAYGVMVLQVRESERKVYGTPAWWPAMQAGYEAAIDHLDGAGLIDRQRVGFMGWSITGVTVGYMLTNSNYPVRAAALVATSDLGWFSYISAGATTDVETLFGGPPFAEGLKNWQRYAPTFNLHKVRTPVLLWAEDSGESLWDWWVGLRRLEKPVEYWVAPDMAHNAFQINHRLTLNQRTVDWFLSYLQEVD